MGGGGHHHHWHGGWRGGWYPAPYPVYIAPPCICPETYAPVLANDGNTYDNACYARCAGVAVVSRVRNVPAGGVHGLGLGPTTLPGARYRPRPARFYTARELARTGMMLMADIGQMCTEARARATRLATLYREGEYTRTSCEAGTGLSTFGCTIPDRLRAAVSAYLKLLQSMGVL